MKTEAATIYGGGSSQRNHMDPKIEQILKVSKEISMSSKRGKPNFIWATEETLGDIRDYLEREEQLLEII